jgi:putative GTP pyrophosphokinase
VTGLQEAIDRYRDELPAFVEAARAMTGKLEEICKQAGVIATVSAREKDLGSFAKKIMTKADYASDPWGMTTDKVGARVITQTLRDRSSVLEALQGSELQILWVDDKQKSVKADELYYPGIHVQVVVPDVRTGDGAPIECEVQLRTKAQDLWSVPSHTLLYKGVVKPPAETARRIWRLSTLVELFDEEVERAMSEVLNTPDYAEAYLLAVAEPRFYTFVQREGYRDLSIEVLHELTDVFPAADERAAYGDTLGEFAEREHNRLSQLYRDYGPGSPFEGEGRYWLFSQPESLLLLERIASSAVVDRDHWASSRRR